MSDLQFIHGQGFKDAPNLIEHKQQAMNPAQKAPVSNGDKGFCLL